MDFKKKMFSGIILVFSRSQYILPTASNGKGQVYPFATKQLFCPPHLNIYLAVPLPPDTIETNQLIHQLVQAADTTKQVQGFVGRGHERMADCVQHCHRAYYDCEAFHHHTQ